LIIEIVPPVEMTITRFFFGCFAILRKFCLQNYVFFATYARENANKSYEVRNMARCNKCKPDGIIFVRS